MPRAASARLIERPRSAALRARIGATLQHAHLPAAPREQQGQQRAHGPGANDGYRASRPRSGAAERRGELFGRAPGVREAVVERHRRDADRVRLAPVADHAALRRALRGPRRARSLPPRTRIDSCAPRCRGSRGRDELDVGAATRLERRLQERASARSDLARSCAMPAPREHSSDASSGAADSTGGLLTCQPAAPAVGSNAPPMRNRVAGLLPHQPSRRGRPGRARGARARRRRRSRRGRRSGTCSCTRPRNRRRCRAARAAGCRSHARGRSRRARRCAARCGRHRAMSNAWPVRYCTPGHSTSASDSPSRGDARFDVFDAQQFFTRARRQFDQRLGRIEAVPAQSAS